MDPLTAFLVSLFGSMVADALQTRRTLRDFYPKSASGELEKYFGWSSMNGEGVEWFVESGRAVWIESRYVRPISGNIFDEHKLGAVAKAVRQAARRRERVPMYAGYGQVHRLTPEWIEESLAYEDESPFTTGDRELDQWLVRRHNQENDDEDENREMEERLAEAVREQWGDLGKWTATVRDGNHRTFGAILGGEERVAVRLYDNDEQTLRELARTGFRDTRNGSRWLEEQKALLEKMIHDTGKKPEWLQEFPVSNSQFPVSGSQSTELRRN